MEIGDKVLLKNGRTGRIVAIYEDGTVIVRFSQTTAGKYNIKDLERK